MSFRHPVVETFHSMSRSLRRATPSLRLEHMAPMSRLGVSYADSNVSKAEALRLKEPLILGLF